MTDDAERRSVGLRELPLPAALVDGHGRIVGASEPFASLVDRQSIALPGSALLDLVAPEDQGRLASAWTNPSATDVDVAGVGDGGLPYLATFAIPGGEPAETRLLVARRRVPSARWVDAPDARDTDGRDEIDSALSHDVRGALRGVAGFLAVLDRGESGLSEESRGFLATARRSAAAADAMAEKLVEYARLAQRPLLVTNVDLGRLATTVVDEQSAVDGGDSLDVSVGDLGSVVGNPTLLEAVVAELLTNAAKFGAHAVDVSIRTEGGWCYLQVKDDGPGIDDDLRTRAFDLFRMLQPKGRYPGIGAGLAIARRVVEVHGGTMWIEGDEGGGAVVVARLLPTA
jgi:signal transduction histidine kinase